MLAGSGDCWYNLGQTSFMADRTPHTSRIITAPRGRSYSSWSFSYRTWRFS
jgi:hypothetical protein